MARAYFKSRQARDVPTGEVLNESASLGPEHQVLKEWEGDAVMDALEELRPNHREVLVLRYFQG